MSKFYRDPRWVEFREQIFEADGYECTHCGKGRAEDKVLQVHHKQYRSGALPWEYPPSDCETICKGCRAKEHGIIPPSAGWEFIQDEDLGGLDGECERCGNDIRYVYTVWHQSWGYLDVGVDCCEDMTQSEEFNEARKRKNRKTRFMSTKNWEQFQDTWSTRFYKINVTIVGDHFDITGSPTSFQIQVEDLIGNQVFASLDEAKAHLFNLYDTGTLQDWVRKQKGV
ncbi:MAG: hypothetical protein WBF53_03155 [Litorimonas sp.]